MQMYGQKQCLYNFGDVMFDVVNLYRNKSITCYPLKNWGLNKNKYVEFVTLHRPYLTDSLNNSTSASEALQEIAEEIPVVILLHPR